MTEIAGFCTLCRSRCGSINVIENGRLVAVRPDPSHPTGQALCPKGRAAPEIVHSTERLLHPLRRTTPKSAATPAWQRVTWDEALDDIAARMQAIAASDGPESVAFGMTSASASSISDYRAWLERFIWSFGSPNICASAELCNWPKDYTHALTFGRGVSTPDYARTGLAVLWGHNPSHTWLAQAGAFTAARSHGAKLVVIDPRRTSLAAQADLWLRVTPGTDGILAAAVAQLLVHGGDYDEQFVRCWTNAPLLVRKDDGLFLRASEIGIGPQSSFVVFDEQSHTPRAYDPMSAASAQDAAHFALQGEVALKAGNRTVWAEPAFAIYVRALDDATLEQAAQTTGIPATQIRAFADLLAAASSTCYYCWTGVGQHADATQIDRALATLFALKGQVDAPGGNVAWPAPRTNPIDDMAILPPGQRAKALGLKDRPLGPAMRSWITAADLYRAILDAEPYRVRALLCFGSNPLVSRSEPGRGRAALQRLDLQVHCDLFYNPTADTADYLLPVNSAWEREGLRVGFEISAEAQSLVQLRPAMVAAIGESRSDFWIAAELAKRLGVGASLFDGDLTRAFDYVLAPAGVSAAQLRASPQGLTLPVQTTWRSYATQGPKGVRGFDTPTRRVEIYSETLHRLGQPPIPTPAHLPKEAAFPLVLTNAKFGHFCHTQHRQIAALRRRSVQPHFSLARAAARVRGISDGDPIEIRTRHGRIRACARIDEHLDERTVVGEYGWWQACDDLGETALPVDGAASSNYNLLTSTGDIDPVSGAPRFRSVACEISRLAVDYERWSGFKPLQVVSVASEAGAVTVVELATPDGAGLPPHRPGQFITVSLDGGSTTRSYSLIHAAHERTDRYVIAVKREEHGLISRAVAALKPGASVLATMPAGRFTLPVRNERPICFIAFGVGITPFMSGLETLAALRDGPEILLCYAAPTPESQPFRARLLELERELPRFSWRSFFSRVDGGKRERFSAASVPQLLIDRRARFYVCGSPAVTRATRLALIARAVPSFEIFEERFQSPAPRQAGSADAPRRITLARSGQEVLWTARGSILDTLSERGIALPSGCRVGQCESCAVRLLEGVVSYSEPPEDLEEGYCLTCSATPATDIVLDA
jgi:anaerobic selenocysteine-containing dehydrogenase/ferredoxin-NADP reductase